LGSLVLYWKGLIWCSKFAYVQKQLASPLILCYQTTSYHSIILRTPLARVC